MYSGTPRRQHISPVGTGPGALDRRGLEASTRRRGVSVRREDHAGSDSRDLIPAPQPRKGFCGAREAAWHRHRHPSKSLAFNGIQVLVGAVHGASASSGEKCLQSCCVVCQQLGKYGFSAGCRDVEYVVEVGSPSIDGAGRGRARAIAQRKVDTSDGVAGSNSDELRNCGCACGRCRKHRSHAANRERHRRQ